MICRAWNSYGSWSLFAYSWVIMTPMNLFWRCFMNWFMVFCAFFAFIFTSSWHLSESYSWVHENIMNFIHGFMAQFIGLTYSYSWTLLDMPWIIHRFHDYIHRFLEYIHRFHEYIFTAGVFFTWEIEKWARKRVFGVFFTGGNYFSCPLFFKYSRIAWSFLKHKLIFVFLWLKLWFPEQKGKNFHGLRG